MKSLTIIMPAYMEAKNLKNAFESAIRAVQKSGILDYELIIVTNLRRDGSHDGTPNIATELARNNKNVRHIHNPSYVNLGFKYWQGVENASKDYVVMIPGDNETVEDSVAGILKNLDKVENEVIVSYTANKEVRAWKRRFVSKGFTTLCNLLFGLRLKYFNGICIHPSKVLKRIPLKSDNFAYMAATLIYLVKSGVKYKEVPMEIKSITNASAAFKFRSVIECLKTLGLLFWQIQIKRQRINLT